MASILCAALLVGLLLSPAAAAESDNGLVRRLIVYEQVDVVWGKVGAASKLRRKSEIAAVPIRGLEILGRDVVATARGVLKPKRKLECTSEELYCSGLDGCCPAEYECCSYGYCLLGGRTCCPNASCGIEEVCCGEDNCYPEGGDCCPDGSSCEAGNSCYTDTDGPICCTDSTCTAHVVDGTTTYATSTGKTRIHTRTMYELTTRDGALTPTSDTKSSTTSTASLQTLVAVASTGFAPTATSTDSAHSHAGSTVNIGAIVGGVLGGVVAVAILFAGLFFLVRKRALQQRDEARLRPGGGPPGDVQTGEIQRQVTPPRRESVVSPLSLHPPWYIQGEAPIIPRPVSDLGTVSSLGPHGSWGNNSVPETPTPPSVGGYLPSIPSAGETLRERGGVGTGNQTRD